MDGIDLFVSISFILDSSFKKSPNKSLLNIIMILTSIILEAVSYIYRKYTINGGTHMLKW